MADPGSRVVQHMLHACQTRGPARARRAWRSTSNVRELPPLTGVGEPASAPCSHRLERRGLVDARGDRLTVRDTARLADYLRYLEMRWKFGDL